MRNKKEALKKTINAFKQFLPVLISVLLLISLINTIFSKEKIKGVFNKDEVSNAIIGSLIGSVSAGNPITSYVIGGELKERGISLVAILSFILAWVTVGIIQLPAEAMMLGRKFAIVRNFFCFLFSIIISFLVVFTLSLL